MIKAVALSLLVTFLALQLVLRPTRSNAVALNPTQDLLTRHAAPPDVQHMLTTACYDCHSNQTRYPWYSQIQPAGWFLQKHVDEGKRALNFSEFGKLSAKRAQKKLENCIDAVSEHEMPLKSYTLIHHDAKLTEDQIKHFVAWAEAEIHHSEAALPENE